MPAAVHPQQPWARQMPGVIGRFVVTGAPRNHALPCCVMVGGEN